jgi:hypothetical protein
MSKLSFLDWDWIDEALGRDFEDEQMWQAVFASEPSPEELVVMDANADELLEDLLADLEV